MMRLVAAIGAIATALLLDTDEERKADEDRILGRISELVDERIEKAFGKWLEPATPPAAPASSEPTPPASSEPTPPASSEPTPRASSPPAAPKRRATIAEVLFGARSE